MLFFVLFAPKLYAMEGLWYYTETPDARESLFKNISKIDLLAPQTYELHTNGEIVSRMKDDVLLLAKENNVKVMPLLANTDGDFFSQKIILDLLDNHENWQKVSAYMRDEAENNDYYGWQLDLENIPISHKNKFTAFVKYLKNEFEKDDLKLSIALVSKISDNKADYTVNYWNNWAGVYDYKVLADNVDFLSIMAYDQPNSPGPVATILWSKKVLNYSLKNVPPEKISFGIPVYGWAYRSKEKRHFRMVKHSLVNTKLLNTNKKDFKNMTTGTGMSKYYGNIPWVSYNMYGKNYTIWYEDEKSFKTKFDQIKAKNVRGYSVWVLGSEDQGVWNLEEL